MYIIAVSSEGLSKKKPAYKMTGIRPQIIESGFKKFDSQTNCISAGNVIANTQYSSYIRPYKEILNCGYTGKEGDLTKFDMQHFSRIPDGIREVLIDKNREQSVILYEFCVYYDKVREVIGYILTDSDSKLVKSYALSSHGFSCQKRIDAIRECMCYVCNF